MYRLNHSFWHNESEMAQILNTKQISNRGFLNAMLSNPCIYRRAFSVMARIVTLSMNWHIIQLFETIHNMMLVQVALPKQSETNQDGTKQCSIGPQGDNITKQVTLKDYFPSRIQPLVSLCGTRCPLVQFNQAIEQCLFETRGEYQDTRGQIWLFLMVSGSSLSVIASHAINPVQEDEVH